MSAAFPESGTLRILLMIKVLVLWSLWSVLAPRSSSALTQEGVYIEATLLDTSDGDTLKVRIDGKKFRVRMLGIDAPECRENPRALTQSSKGGIKLQTVLDQGRRSHEHLRKLLRGTNKLRLELDVQEKDRYGRLLAYVYLQDGTMLNEKMVADGYAMLLTYPPNVKYVKRLRRALQQAELSKKGLWAELPSKGGDALPSARHKN
jgi:micrococcal nuclease